MQVPSLIDIFKKRDKNVSHTWLLFCKRKNLLNNSNRYFLIPKTKDNPLHVIKFDFCQIRGHFAIFGDHVMNISNNKWALSHTLRTSKPYDAVNLELTIDKWDFLIFQLQTL